MFFNLAKLPAERVLKLHEGRPHAGDIIANGNYISKRPGSI